MKAVAKSLLRDSGKSVENRDAKSGGLGEPVCANFSPTLYVWVFFAYFSLIGVVSLMLGFFYYYFRFLNLFFFVR